MSETAAIAENTAPVKATWILLAVAWVLFAIPFPGTGVIGWIVNFAAFIMAIVVMVKGRVASGVIQLICSIIVSPIIYFICVMVLFAAAGTALTAAEQQSSSAESKVN
jgi:hypothetical protein